MEYTIEKSALEAYCHLFIHSLQESIVELSESEYRIYIDNKLLALNFFDHHITAVEIKNKKIINIILIKYEVFFSDEFINKFSNLDFLAPRLKRYLKLGNDRFRSELIEAFQANHIVQDNHKKTSFFWEEYNLNIIFKENKLIEVF